MVVLRLNTKGNIDNHDGSGSSSSNSKRSRSKVASNPSLGNSKRLRSRVVRARPDPDNQVAKPKKERTRTYKQVQDAVRPYAADAMNVYNKRAGTKYELVEPGCLRSVLLMTCFLHHVDFTAKKTDVADAPVEMFFAELTTTRGFIASSFAEAWGQETRFQEIKPTAVVTASRTIFSILGVEDSRVAVSGGFSRGGEGLFLDLLLAKASTVYVNNIYKNISFHHHLI